MENMYTNGLFLKNIIYEINKEKLAAVLAWKMLF